MPTKNPRINVVLEKPLYKSVQHLAERKNIAFIKSPRLDKRGYRVRRRYSIICIC